MNSSYSNHISLSFARIKVQSDDVDIKRSVNSNVIELSNQYGKGGKVGLFAANVKDVIWSTFRIECKGKTTK